MWRLADEVDGTEASYIDGKLTDNPRPGAGNQGTQITVEDLFYNVPVRRRALRGVEEYGKVYEVVSRYAIHNSSVGFSLKKPSQQNADIRTPSNSSTIDNIRTIFGPAVARELLNVDCIDEKLKFHCQGLITNANYSVKKCTFLLFINHRLVDCTVLRRALETVYSSYLPKGSHPFIYLALEIDPANVDVNVHPTKHEVFFLNQDEIIDAIQRGVEARLLSCKNTRAYFTQGLLPGAGKVGSPSKDNKEGDGGQDTHKDPNKKYAHEIIRTDSRAQKMEKFFSRPGESDAEMKRQNEEEEGGEREEKGNSAPAKPQYNRKETTLTSVLSLRKEVQSNSHSQLLESVRALTFVGCVNRQHALIQHMHSLFLVNTCALSEELFYQITLKDFENFGILKLSRPVDIAELALVALESPESEWSEEDGRKEDLADFMKTLLVSNAKMLETYFSLEIDDDGRICTLPYLLVIFAELLEVLVMALEALHEEAKPLGLEVSWLKTKVQVFGGLLDETVESVYACGEDIEILESFTYLGSAVHNDDQYVPRMEGLPMFIIRLGSEVDWSKESDCFEGFARELARFYAVHAEESEEEEDDDDKEDGEAAENEHKGRGWKWDIEHLIFPAVKKYFYPPQHFGQDTTFLQIANLTELYKVFERC
ncbi:DNA mismatch repair protein Mlh1 [Chionoecetes opilio]|uniref:DNA mismatch repair protein Mlh1 n=1 Tax=Chionoecetes opilio TaxID=41210 RepID=A0A8J5CRS4_CHIOP|nr:DNA mismatch repair protein Mlh1 [Chionoecetes opilio]